MIRISALGGLSVRDSDGKPVAGAAAQPRRMAILALLARAGQRGVTREKLLSLLWPDADDERGPRTLAQALYALRKDLGAEDAISGSKELSFDPALVSSDVSEFASAVARGDDERAVSLYQGPFLDGFHLSGANEFSRWVETERTSLAQEHSRALESLARAARAAGDTRTALGWWRKLAGLEPLNARVTVGLMEALVAAGDRAGALQHARVYELLVEQELDLPPDRDVLALAEQLRRTADEPAPVAASSSVSRPVVTVAEVAAPEPKTVSAAPSSVDEQPLAQAPPSATEALTVTPGRKRSPLAIGALSAIALAIVAAVGFVLRNSATPRDNASAGSGPVVAIGNIAAFGGDSAQASLTAPLADLLTTSLARVHSIRVVSHGRMLELIRSAGNATDTTAGRFVDAARQAGATEVIDGTLYRRPGGTLRLDLRRVDLKTGAIGDVHTVEGSDLFALVDSGTARVVASLGAAAPSGSVADVTTRSITAYRMYEEGVRAYYRGDVNTALRFFDGALSEDSLFALAAYYSALSDPAPATYLARMERAKRLATRSTDLERLTITAGWASSVSSPNFRAIAETLATRYPGEVEGHLYLGMARVLDGEFLLARTSLERAIAMDTLGLRGTRARCLACDAFGWLVGGLMLADSMTASEHEARRWLRLHPQSATAATALVHVLEIEGRGAEADSLFHAAPPTNQSYLHAVDFQSSHLIRIGDYASADRMLLLQLREADPRPQSTALWNLTISLREQGRMVEALKRAQSARMPTGRILKRTNPPPINVLEAQTLLEMGRPKEAAILFDSLSRQHNPGDVESQISRATAWSLTHAASARFAAGDTATLQRLADSVRALGEASGYGRDRRLHHYVRGLLLAARHDDAAAITELRSAIYSINAGYTRINYELARVYLRAQRPRDAIAILQPTLRGDLEASNLYLNRTEIHELLAQAWDAAGVKDSAVTHYAWVAKAWNAADPNIQPRAQAAQARLTALTR